MHMWLGKHTHTHRVTLPLIETDSTWLILMEEEGRESIMKYRIYRSALEE